MKLINKWVCSLLCLVIVLSGNASVTGAALSDTNSVRDCIGNQECTEEQQSDEGNATTGSAPEQEASSVGVGLSDIIRTIVALAFVVALLYFLLKFVNKKSRSYQESHLVRHLGGTPLGGSRSVQVVKIGNSVLVLGVGEEVALLKEVTEPEERDAIVARYDDQAEAALQPVDVINKLKKRFEKKDQPVNRTPFKQEFEQKINELQKDRKKAMKELADRERDHHE